MNYLFFLRSLTPVIASMPSPIAYQIFEASCASIISELFKSIIKKYLQNFLLKITIIHAAFSTTINLFRVFFAQNTF